MLGVTLGAVASGTIHVDVESGLVDTDFISAWLAPFPFAIGLFTLTLCALLAAVYLTLETDDPTLQEDFRQRALIAAVSVGAMAGLSFILSAEGGPIDSTWTRWSTLVCPISGLNRCGSTLGNLDDLEPSISPRAYPRPDTGYADCLRLGTGAVSVSCRAGFNLFKHSCTRCRAASDAHCVGCRWCSVDPRILVSLRCI